MNLLTSAIILSCVVVQTFAASAPVLSDIQPRITGGTAASRHQFPYQISLQHRLLVVGPYTHLCGGSIITPTWILTAAHCKQNTGTYQVIAGMLILGENNPDIQVRKVVKFIRHADYKGGASRYDIGLVQLETALVYSDAVQPINIPQEAGEVSGEVVVSGWGSTSTTIVPNYPKNLQFMNVPILPFDDCETALIQSFGTAGSIDETNLCTGSYNQKMSTCSGDGGGPLVQNDTVFGIVSWGVHPCGFNGAPSVYTNVIDYRDFIAAIVTDL